MVIYIENKTKIKNVIINLMNDNYNIEEKVKLNNNQIDIDLCKYKYLSFDFNDKSSEIVILSKNISKLVIKYNRKIKKYNINLEVNNCYDYGRVESFTLKDEKNLFYRSDKKKNINVLLPSNYSKDKKYGVIVMFDSQNIFDLSKVGNYTLKNDPYGGWQVETSLKRISELFTKEYIVVGIENADEYREIELTPSQSLGKFKDIVLSLNDENLLNGHLDCLGDFINETLLPFIDNKYSIDNNEIGIVGSSCGGLASYYLGLRDYKKYKFIFTFTPATGFIEDETLRKFYKTIDFKKNKNNLPYIFYYQGKNGELEELLYNLNKNLLSVLFEEGYPYKLVEQYIEKSAEHNETMWRYGFNYAIIKYIEKEEDIYEW